MKDDYLRKAEEVLLSSEILTQKAFGSDMDLSENSWALTVILKNSNDPSQVFHRLASSGRVYAMAYALVGSYKTDRGLYDNLKTELADENLALWYKVGDQTLSIQMSDVFSMLEKDDLLAELVFEDVPDFFETVRPILENSLRNMQSVPSYRAKGLPEELKMD